MNQELLNVMQDAELIERELRDFYSKDFDIK